MQKLQIKTNDAANLRGHSPQRWLLGKAGGQPFRRGLVLCPRVCALHTLVVFIFFYFYLLF